MSKPPTVQGTLNKIIRANQVDDRREYCVEDFVGAYGLVYADAYELHRRFRENDRIEIIPVRDVPKPASYVQRFEAMDPLTLGRAMKEYVAETVHGSFEGFSRREQRAIEAMFEDFILAVDSGLVDDPQS